VKKSEEIQLDFEIDKLTNSIENAISGEFFDTHISQISETRIIKKTNWIFDWHSEIKSKSKSIYCLTTLNNQKIIQGLISYDKFQKNGRQRFCFYQQKLERKRRQRV